MRPRLSRRGPVIVGISAHFHDSACCLLRDGRLLAAAEEERFTGVKFDPRMPAHAFAYCLREAGLTISDVDCVAYYEDPVKKLGRQLWMFASGLPGAAVERHFDPHRAEREIRGLLGFEGRLEICDHHASHAASSFFFSPFEEAACLTSDGVGEWATTTYSRCAGSSIELLDAVQFPHSLGLLYATITSYLGFRVNDGEYKVMGLAPYGRPRFLAAVRGLVHTLERGQFALEPEYFDFSRPDRMYSERMADLFGCTPRQPHAPIEPFHADIACSVQHVLEEILLEQVRHLHSIVPSKNLCMAGGVALNCVANGRIYREGPFAHLFVQPAANDAGGALGAAAIAHLRVTGDRPDMCAMEHAYWGPSYGPDDVENILKATPLVSADYRHAEDDLLEAVVDRLVDGKVIGWFHGRMEFGPRALGARSILADPRATGMRERINQLIKNREEFRPFAPAVLLEHAAEHFELDHASPFMLETCRVRSALPLPAVTHVDGSARVQTVDARVSPRFAALLRAFHRRTGCPILLNTSFNVRDQPIVRTPLLALECFAVSGLDALVLQDFLIDAEAVPPSWRAHKSVGSRLGIRHSVYTFL